MDFKRAALVIVCHYQGSDRNRKTTYNMPRSFLVRGRQSSSGPTEKSSNTSKEKISGERITRQIMCLEYIYIYIYSKHIICRVILSPEIFSLLVFEDFSVGPELLCLPLTRNERGML